MTARQSRVLRAGAAAFLATLVSACAHTLGGGGSPGALVVLAVALLATPISVMLVGRTRSLPRLVTAVLASQALLHIAFAATAGADAGAAASAHTHAQHALAAGAVGAGPHAALIPDAAMLGAHLVAAAVTVAVIRRGESVGLAIVRSVARIVVAPDVVVQVPTSTPVLSGTGAPTFADMTRLRSVLTRRGPPAR